MFGLALKSDLDAARDQRHEMFNREQDTRKRLRSCQEENSQLAERVIELERRNENLVEALVGMTEALKNGCDIDINVRMEDE